MDIHVRPAESRLPDDPVVPARRTGRPKLASRWAAFVALAVLATSAALVGTASSASANPTNCTTVNGGNFAESRCTEGTGEHRVVMRQQHFNPQVGPIACEGPWVPAGTVSRTACAYHQVISVTVETRGTSGPGMTPQPEMPQMPDASPNCRQTGNGARIVVVPTGEPAFWFGFTLEYCYDSNRDLVRVTPVVFQPRIMLPPFVGTVTINAVIPALGAITANDNPVRTSQGQIYSGLLTVSFTGTIRGGAPQRYQASVGVVINDSTAFPTPPALIRFS